MHTAWYGLVIDRHLLAAISITGMVLDVLGGLYLAYDLLGGTHGPLRLLTSIVSYSVLFIIGYGLPLGLPFGLVVGVGFGLTLGLEYGHIQHEQRGGKATSSHHHLLFSLFRGLVLGLAAMLTFGWLFGLIFGLLASSGFILQYVMGFSPRGAYRVTKKPQIRGRVLLASFLVCIFTGGPAMIAGMLTGEGVSDVILIGLKLGLVFGLVSGVVSIFSPSVMWWAEHLPVHRLGVFGTGLLLLGFILQSFQYWATLLNLSIK